MADSIVLLSKLGGASSGAGSSGESSTVLLPKLGSASSGVVNSTGNSTTVLSKFGAKVSSTSQGGHTSSVSVDAMFGGAVKGSLSKFLERRDQRIIDLALAPGDDNIAQLCWGGINKNNPRIGLSSGASNRKSKDEKPKDPPTEKSLTWNEQERFVVKTKITNPEDSEQYIWVNVCKAMVITAPSQEPFNGKKHTFIFKGKETVIGTEDGGSSGTDNANEAAVQKSAGSPTPGPGPNTPPGSGTQGSAAP